MVEHHALTVSNFVERFQEAVNESLEEQDFLVDWINFQDEEGESSTWLSSIQENPVPQKEDKQEKHSSILTEKKFNKPIQNEPIKSDKPIQNDLFQDKPIKPNKPFQDKPIEPNQPNESEIPNEPKLPNEQPDKPKQPDEAEPDHYQKFNEFMNKINKVIDRKYLLENEPIQQRIKKANFSKQFVEILKIKINIKAITLFKKEQYEHIKSSIKNIKYNNRKKLNLEEYIDQWIINSIVSDNDKLNLQILYRRKSTYF
ncbi:4043_t:CDS:2 [Gigaspora margarita]|uniref:4043_t:CDS:1 n=1 Tax=Gigaspora margarita TaxID=4874 RepID=A0ABN7UEA9_GIGMA|nr:4043_t:CDS:2 [Gigaspora margarita]